MKIKPSKSPGSVVMELGDHDSDRLSGPVGESPFNLRTLLVPVDFSNCSKKALQYAVPFAKQFNAAIVLLHVVPRRSAIVEKPSAVNYEAEMEKALQENATEQLKEFAADFLPRDVRVRIEACLGAEGVEIAAEAKRLEADLIVISTHGRAGRANALASVAGKLVQIAPCPVLVVREHEHEFIEHKLANPLSKAAS